MAITVSQQLAIADAYSGAFGSTVPAGDTVFIKAFSFNTTGNPITGTSPLFNGSAVTGAVQLASVQSALLGGVSTWATVWMLPNVPAPGTTVALTVTNGTLNTADGLVIYDVAGLGASPTADVNVSNPQTASGNSTAAATGTLNTTGVPDLLLGGNVMSAGGQASGSAGFTSQGIGGASFGGYLIAPSTTSQAWSVTGSTGAWCALLTAVTATPASSGFTWTTLPASARFLPFAHWPQAGAEAGGDGLTWFPG